MKRRPKPSRRGIAVALVLLAGSIGATQRPRRAELVRIEHAEPFVVRQGETVVLEVEGAGFRERMRALVLRDGRRDRSVDFLEWLRLDDGRARVTLEVAADAEPGVRGLRLKRPGHRGRQEAVFRVARSEQLRWPHEPPGLGPAARERLRDEVFVINDFGAYQASPTDRQFIYFHDGLDFVLPAGTRLYSLADGVVRDIDDDNGPGYSSIAIEDQDAPGVGWIYVHTDRYLVAEGDHVQEGQLIGEIADFPGLAHLHLNRARVPAGASWALLQNHLNIHVADSFPFIDDEPPTLHETLSFFRNGSTEILGQGAAVPVIGGDVDMVASIRDGGHYAHWNGGGFFGNGGDRLTAAVIRTEVFDATGARVATWVVDLTRLVLFWKPGQLSIAAPDRTMTIFKPHLDMPGTIAGSFSHYVLTNSRGITRPGEVDPDDQRFSWRTAATRRDGSRRFPDGRYTVRVTAWDTNGNRAMIEGSVRVVNDG